MASDAVGCSCPLLPFPAVACPPRWPRWAPRPFSPSSRSGGPLPLHAAEGQRALLPARRPPLRHAALLGRLVRGCHGRGSGFLPRQLRGALLSAGDRCPPRHPQPDSAASCSCSDSALPLNLGFAQLGFRTACVGSRTGYHHWVPPHPGSIRHPEHPLPPALPSPCSVRFPRRQHGLLLPRGRFSPGAPQPPERPRSDPGDAPGPAGGARAAQDQSAGTGDGAKHPQGQEEPHPAASPGTLPAVPIRDRAGDEPGPRPAPEGSPQCPWQSVACSLAPLCCSPSNTVPPSPQPKEEKQHVCVTRGAVSHPGLCPGYKLLVYLQYIDILSIYIYMYFF